MADCVDQIARDSARDALHGVEVTEVKLDGLNTKMDTHHKENNEKFDRLESILKWAGGLIVMLFISTLTWSLAQQYNANEAQKKDMQQQIQLMQEQQQAAALASAASAAQPSNTASAGR